MSVHGKLLKRVVLTVPPLRCGLVQAQVGSERPLTLRTAGRYGAMRHPTMSLLHWSALESLGMVRTPLWGSRGGLYSRIVNAWDWNVRGEHSSGRREGALSIMQLLVCCHGMLLNESACVYE